MPEEPEVSYQGPQCIKEDRGDRSKPRIYTSFSCTDELQGRTSCTMATEKKALEQRKDRSEQRVNPRFKSYYLRQTHLVSITKVMLLEIINSLLQIILPRNSSLPPLIATSPLSSSPPSIPDRVFRVPHS